MKKLLIYNGNVPEESIRDFAEKAVFRVSLAELADENFNNDVYCDNELSKCCNEEYDIIYITLNQSEYDYLAMEGLRIAHHIRLSLKYKNTRTPIVILCQENLEQILKLSNLGNILITPRTYLSSDLTLSEEISLDRISDEQYKSYLNLTNIEPPGNYQSHHSIANEWALYRYASAIKKPNKESALEHFNDLKSKLNSLSYLNTLHFKYHEILYKRQSFKEREKEKDEIFGIEGIEGKKIGLIEDEYAKGWVDFYSCMLEESGAQLIPFTEFNKSLEKEELIKKLENWLQQQINTDNICDLYIIDLRLHDDDFYEKIPDLLSGFLLSNFLKEKNPGIQILISTASDKLRNFQAFIKRGVFNFAIKESPETNYNRKETGYLISDLQIEIREGCSKSYLAKIYSEVEKIDLNHKYQGSISQKEEKFKNKVFGHHGLLRDTFKYLNSRDEFMIYNSLMTCFSILEEYFNLYGSFSLKINPEIDNWKIVDLDGNNVVVYNYKKEDRKNFTSKCFTLKNGVYEDLIRKDELEKEKEKNQSKTIDFHISQSSTEQWIKPFFMLKAALVLYIRDNVQQKDLNRLFKLKWIRNNIAHSGILKPNYKLHPEEIEFFITKIFKNILM